MVPGGSNRQVLRGLCLVVLLSASVGCRGSGSPTGPGPDASVLPRFDLVLQGDGSAQDVPGQAHDLPQMQGQDLPQMQGQDLPQMQGQDRPQPGQDVPPPPSDLPPLGQLSCSMP